MPLSRLLLVTGALASMAGLVSCIPGDPTGSAGLNSALLVRADLSATQAATVVVEISAPDIPATLAFNIPVAGSTASGTITVPTGSARTITLRAYDAGGIETHRGSVTTGIHPTTPTVSIVLQPLIGDVPITGTLGSFAVSVTPAAATLAPGETATLQATILDANAQPVTGQAVWGAIAPAVATVVSTGQQAARVTAVAVGQTQVVATFGGTATTSTITVTAAATPSLQLVATGLTSALYVTAPPADLSRVFIVQQTGQVRVLRNDMLLATPFLDISPLVDATGGERGLFSVAFHPSYAQNGRFFIDYTDLAGNIKVVRYQVSAANPDVADPSSAVTILTVAHPVYSRHYGGLVMFGPDGYLYISTGDGGSVGDEDHNAQDSTRLLGKVLRIDVNSGTPYAIPPTNPFVGRPPAAPEVWAYGLRNPWRFSFDRTTGDLYISDAGELLWEEVDVLPAGAAGGQNYGWSTMEGGHCFTPTIGCNTAGLVLPTFEYPHGPDGSNGCAIIGGYVYRGTRLPMLTGRYLYADFCTGWIRSFRYSSGAATDPQDHTSWFGLHPFITSLGQDARGELYVTLIDGSVYRIAPL